MPAPFSEEELKMTKKKTNAVIDAVMKRKKLAAAAAVLIVVLIILAAVMASRGGKQKSMPAGMIGVPEMNNVATVKAETPKTGNIERTTSLAGTVEPADVVYVYAKAGGDVTSVSVKAGDTVKAGQLLCTIDTEQVDGAKNSMDSAAISLSEAQSTLSRMQLLYEGGDISDQEWEQYQNNVKSAKLQYESAKLSYEKQVEYSSVTAPIGGRIESCDLEVYDRVNQSDQLCVISGEGNKRVSFYVTENVVQNLSQGDAMTIERDGHSYGGRISDISTMVDDSNGLFKIKADLAEADAVATGSVVKVKVVSERAEGVMTVPVDAIYYDGGVGNVYVYENGTVHKKEVEVGLYDSEIAEIRSGLTADDQVISTWSSQLYEGSTVNLKSEEEPAEAAVEAAVEATGAAEAGAAAEAEAPAEKTAEEPAGGDN